VQLRRTHDVGIAFAPTAAVIGDSFDVAAVDTVAASI